MVKKPTYEELEKKILKLEKENACLKESENKFRRLSESCPDMRYQMSLPDGKYEYVSHASTLISGYPPEIWYESPLLIREILHPEFHSYFDEQFENMLNGQVSPSDEYKIIHKNRTERWISQRNILVIDEKGNPIAIEGIITDITEQKRTDTTLELEQKRFNALLENIPGYIYLQARDYTIRYANDYFKKHFGEPKDRFCYEVMCGRNKPCEKCPTFEVFDTKTPISWEWNHAPDNRTYAIYNFPFVDTDGSELVLEIGMDITNRKQLEGALQESEERYRNLFNSIRDAILVSDIDRSIIDCNPAFTELFGYSIDEIKGKKTRHIYENETQFQELGKALQDHYGTSPFLKTVNYMKKNGEVFPGETGVFYLSNQEGDVGGFIGLIRDITERKKTERSLIKSESLFRGLFDNMTSGSAIYEVINNGSKGSDYIVKAFNKKSLDIENQTLDQVVGKTLFDLRPNIDDYGLISAMKNVWETGEPGYFPVKIYEDERFSNYYENYIFKIPTGEVVTIYNDITDHKNAEIALKESEERFALAMEFASDGLFDWNLETNKIYYSPVWKRMLGYEEDELPNDFSVWETLTHPEDVERSWKMLNELIHKQRDKFEIEFKMQHKDGHWVDILSRANALFDEHNKAVRVVGTHVDISERKKLENQLFQSQKLESIGNLAGGIAHEFNNILSIIIGNNELVMEDLPQWSLARESTEEIRIAGLRARDVVKQLLTFSRQDNAAKKVINIASAVHDSMKLIRSSTPADIEIQQTLSDDVYAILGNATQINQILINLCNNAVDAMPNRGGKLAVVLSNETVEEKQNKYHANLRPGPYVKLTVSDNGIGMDKKLLDKVFDPYYTTKDVGKGTGLGLAIVHGIVERSGGAIIVDSHPGQGTTFTVFLPGHESKLEHDTDKSAVLPTGKECILYVDDEPSLSKLGKRHLESLGYTVESTTDPLEALEMVKQAPHKFDLVISDMAMPHMTGDQLIVEILRILPDMPSIICTGYSAKISKEDAAKIGISSFVMKPMDKATLSKTVRKVLDEASIKIQ